MTRLVVLANGASGATEDEDERLRTIRAAFREAGADPPVHCVHGDGLAAAGRDAVADGAEVIVAAGGDGSVSTLAGVVAGSRASLAVLPMGTLNHFAKDARLPLDVKDAARVAVHGSATPVDVAEVNGRVFVNNASIGLYPAALDGRDDLLSPGGSKGVAMVRAAGAALRHLEAHRLRLTVDGRTSVRTTSFVFVGNNAYETSLGRLGKRATLRGQRLSVYTTRRPSRRAVLGLAARALVGRMETAPDFEAHEARRVVVDSRRRRLRAGIDGEVTTLHAPLRFAMRPAALSLVRGMR